MTQVQKTAAAFISFATALVAIAIALWHWSNIESGAVVIAVETGTALVVSVILHVKPGTKKQPVLLQTAITSFGAAVIGLAAAFLWFSWTLEVYGLVGAAWVALVSLVFAPITYNSVTAEVTPPLESRELDPI